MESQHDRVDQRAIGYRSDATVVYIRLLDKNYEVIKDAGNIHYIEVQNTLYIIIWKSHQYFNKSTCLLGTHIFTAIDVYNF